MADQTTARRVAAIKRMWADPEMSDVLRLLFDDEDVMVAFLESVADQVDGDEPTGVQTWQA